jgi:replicative DNA helicase
LGNVGVDYMKKLKTIRESGVPPFVAETGLRDIDKLIGGFSEGEFILLAARPSMGKTALALQIARNNIAKGRAVGFITLEMSKEAIFLRQLSSTSRINSMRIKSGQITKVEYDYLASVWSDMNAEPFYIDDKAPLNETSLRGIARRMVSLFDVDFLIVDYLQLMDSSKGKESRQQEISCISRAFKNLSKELKIPIMALSQLSRAVEARNPPRPMMSDLRESGSLEQDADAIIFIYRPEYYNIDSFPDGSPTTGLAEIIVSKARNAETGSINTVFIKDTGRFENLAKDNIN